jgi:hypothetical protein
MNQYGEQARRYWQENLPRQYAQISNPQRFFEQMGERIAEEVEQLTIEMAGLDQAGEGYLGKVGRLQMARASAETEVMRHTLPQPEPDEPAQPHATTTG